MLASTTGGREPRLSRTYVVDRVPYAEYVDSAGNRHLGALACKSSANYMSIVRKKKGTHPSQNQMKPQTNYTQLIHGRQ
jgi:hypothetical protein